MIGISNLKSIEWQDGWYEMFYIVDFAMLKYYVHYLVLVQFIKIIWCQKLASLNTYI